MVLGTVCHRIDGYIRGTRLHAQNMEFSGVSHQGQKESKQEKATKANKQILTRSIVLLAREHTEMPN